MKILLTLFGSVVLASQTYAQDKSSVIPSCNPKIPQPSVTVGRPKVYTYQRVFPLLDGRFQDTAAINVSQLTLTPDAANASYLDAIQTGISASVAFNPVAGALNSAATQNYTAAMSFQKDLIGQEQIMLSQLQAAQTKQIAAQAAVDALSPTDATNTANPQVVALAAAKNQVTLAQSQLTTVQSLVASQSAPSYISPGTAPTPTALGTLPALQNQSAATPSLPPTRQLENQVEILGDRLTKVLGALTQPDELYGRSLFLIELNPSVHYSPKKNVLLRAGYKVTCGGNPTTVIELYPRTSTVNVADNKYRDSKLSLSFLLSLFSTSASASYNREHLRQTQALAESSYVTGFGIGESSFGWTFGKVFGQDTVSPGVKSTYALVAGDTACTSATALKVEQEGLQWVRENARPLEDKASSKTTLGEWTYGANTFANSSARAIHIQKMAYSPIAYDATKPSATNNSVLVSMEFDRDLDYQLSLTEEGSLIKRVRDTFGRATPTGGSGGLLEATQLDPMTWIPTGARSLLLKLDSSKIELGFPQIYFSSPLSTTSLSDALNIPPTSPSIDIKVMGKKLDCGNEKDSCDLEMLPAASYVSGLFKPMFVARYIEPAISKGDPDTDAIFLTLDTSQTANALSLLPGSQVLTSGSGPTWSSAAKAALIDTTNGTMYPLLCSTDDPPRLTCRYPARKDKAILASGHRYQIAVADSQYNGVGAIVSLKDAVCDPIIKNCEKPLLWSYPPPLEKASAGKKYWRLSPTILGITGGTKVDLELNNQALLPGKVQCPAAVQLTLIKCLVYFDIHPEDLPKLDDFMKLYVADDKSNPITIGRVALGLSPIVSKMTVSTDTVTLSGLNLAFDELQVGADGKRFNAGNYCVLLPDGRSSCVFPTKEFGEKAGIVYYAYKGQPVAAVNTIASDNSLTSLPYAPPPKPDPKAAKATPNADLLSATNLQSQADSVQIAKEKVATRTLAVQ